MCAPWHRSEWDWTPEIADLDENFPGEKLGVFKKRGDPTWELTNWSNTGIAIPPHYGGEVAFSEKTSPPFLGPLGGKIYPPFLGPLGGKF